MDFTPKCKCGKTATIGNAVGFWTYSKNPLSDSSSFFRGCEDCYFELSPSNQSSWSPYQEYHHAAS